MLKKNSLIWDDYYKNKTSILKYPDENLVRIVEKFYKPSWQSALDYGCGQGRHIQYLFQKEIKEIYGVDYSPSVIEMNQSLYPYAKFIFYTPTNYQELPFPSAYFDIIICWGVLHYNTSSIRNFLLGEFYRILNKKGCLLGTYRAKTDTHFFQSDIHNCDIYYFDEQEIIEELTPYYTNIQIGYTERSPIGKLSEKIAHYFFIASKE